MATLAVVGFGFAGIQKAKATTPCPPGKADSCSYTSLPPCTPGTVLAPYTAPYTTTYNYPNGTPIVVSGTYTCTNVGLAPLAPAYYTSECRDCDGNCVAHYGKYWTSRKQCTATCTVTYNNPITGSPTSIAAPPVAYGAQGVDNWFEVTGDCDHYNPALHPLLPRPW